MLAPPLKLRRHAVSASVLDASDVCFGCLLWMLALDACFGWILWMLALAGFFGENADQADCAGFRGSDFCALMAFCQL